MNDQMPCSNTDALTRYEKELEQSINLSEQLEVIEEVKDEVYKMFRNNNMRFWEGLFGEGLNDDERNKLIETLKTGYAFSSDSRYSSEVKMPYHAKVGEMIIKNIEDYLWDEAFRIVLARRDN